VLSEVEHRCINRELIQPRIPLSSPIFGGQDQGRKRVPPGLVFWMLVLTQPNLLRGNRPRYGRERKCCSFLVYQARTVRLGKALFFLSTPIELELELILSQMAQKPMLRGEVGARALRVRSDVRGHG